MEALSLPFMFLGPTASGKLTYARKLIESAYNTKLSLPLEQHTFTVGDNYEAKVLASPYHFEIDIPNLSMQDKQIIGDLLTTFFNSGDVLNSLRADSRKLVILRRAHALSLPAAIRVRAILNQFVLKPDCGGMVWLTAREYSGSIALLSDVFVVKSIPRISYSTWLTYDIRHECKTPEAYDRCNGRLERAQEVAKYFPDREIQWPRRIYDYYVEMMKILIDVAQSKHEPNLNVILWIRARIYQALSLCQNAPDIIDSFAFAILANRQFLEPRVFWLAMESLSKSEPHTSYRTPLSLEAALLRLFEVIRLNSTGKSQPLANVCISTLQGNSGSNTESNTSTPKTIKRRVTKSKK